MDNKLKPLVAIIVCAWPPQGGGIGNNAYYHAGQLAQRGHKVGVFTPDFSGIQLPQDGYELFNLKTWLNFGKAGFLSGLFKRLNNYDIIHLYYPFFGADLQVWLYKKIRPSVKIVLHYEMDPIGEGIKSVIFLVYIKLLLGLIVRASDRVGVLSFDHAENSYLARFLKRWPDKFIELPNGIDAKIFKILAKDEQLMKLNNISVQDKVVVFVGGLDQQHYFKGVPVLLEAFKSLPVNYFPDILEGGVQRGVLQELRGQAKLMIIGDGDLRKKFEQQAKDLGIADRVIFTGWIKNEDLPRYYALADVFVLPSTASTESFGIVVAEAQACGLPAIVSNWPGVRTTIIDGITGFAISPNNPSILAEKIKILLTESSLRQSFSAAGQANAVAKYDWTAIADRIESLYSELTQEISIVSETSDSEAKKICIIHSIYKPFSRGGAEVVVDNIVQGLKASGKEIFIISVGYENKIEVIDGIKVYRIKPFNLFNFLDINGQPDWKRLFWHLIDMFNDIQTWRIYKILKTEQPIEVWTHSLMGLGYEIPRLLKILQIRHIHTVHDMQLIHPSGLLGDDQKLSIPAQAYAWACRRLFGSPDAVVFPSDYIRDIYSRLNFFKKSKLAVLGNPLSSAMKFAIAKTPSDKFVMAYVGQIEDYKGVIDLIKVVSGLMGEWELLVAGDGSAMREATKWSVDNPKIKLLGRLDDAQLEQQIWSRADLLINPSKVAESFGLVVIEAYARGIPVLAAKIGALAELVRDGETGWLFKSGDQLDLKRSIEFIMANREQLKEMKSNCLVEAKRFELDTYLRHVKEL